MLKDALQIYLNPLMAREHALGPGSHDSCYLSQIFLLLFPDGFIVALRDIFSAISLS